MPPMRLVAPENGSAFQRRDAYILLEWQPHSQALAGDQYYLVTMAYAHETATWYDFQWTRASSLEVPGYLYDLVTGNRVLSWSVGLVQLTKGKAEGDPTGRAKALAGASEVRSFVWNLSRASGLASLPPGSSRRSFLGLLVLGGVLAHLVSERGRSRPARMRGRRTTLGGAGRDQARGA